MQMDVIGWALPEPPKAGAVPAATGTKGGAGKGKAPAATGANS